MNYPNDLPNPQTNELILKSDIHNAGLEDEIVYCKVLLFSKESKILSGDTK